MQTINYYSKKLQSKFPLNVFGHMVFEIDVLEIEINQKKIGLIHHLPYFHKISLNEKAEWIKEYFKSWSKERPWMDFEIGFNQFNLSNEEKIQLSKISPEILYCFETLLLQDKLKNISIDEYHIKSHTLVSSENFTVGQNEFLKFKISPKSIQNENWYHSLLSQNIRKIRFDGNRQFEIEELLKLIHSMPEELIKKIEFIEDPFKNFYDSFLFYKLTQINVAIDESLVFYLNNLDHVPIEFPIIIKPSLIGISKTLEFIKLNKKRKIIISSSYEPIEILKGLHFIASYSDNFTQQQNIHGLEVVKYL